MFRIGKEEIDAVTRVIESKQLFKINKGLRETEHAEEQMREIFGAEHALFMTSGHAALVSALIAMGVGPGDEVIVPAYTYIATAMAVVAAGAMPVIVEADETLTISPEAIEKSITKHTKAIMPVHIQGFPCDMDAITAIAKKHGLFVLEDACQADGGTYKGKRLGTIGTAGALSFNYFKVISAGEGGALLTNDKSIADKALIYHDSSAVAFFGEQLKDVNVEPFCGNEYRVGEISSAILRVQLGRMDGILSDLRRVKNTIVEAISDVATLVPTNDPDGGCATTLALRFDTEAEARAFATAEGVNGTVPFDTGKHVYTNWTPIMNKTGALNPLMDPFKMEANKDIVPDYRIDMCPKTLDYLSRTVYMMMNPDWTKEEIDAKIAVIRKALAK